MVDRPLVAIPIRSFDNPKTRLAAVIPDTPRRTLGRALAARTAWVARDAGADVVIIAGSDAVAAWSTHIGFPSIRQPDEAPGLNRAAALGIEAAAGRSRRGFVLHADLPGLTTNVLRPILRLGGPVIAPSHDGGTTLLGGIDPTFRFAYGPASFHRHLSAVPRATIVITMALALDLDTPADLTRGLRSPAGRWMRRYVASFAGRRPDPVPSP